MADARAVLTDLLMKRQQAAAPPEVGWERENKPGSSAAFGEYTYTVGDKKLVLHEGFHELGHRVWDCCPLMGKLFEHQSSLDPEKSDPRLLVRGRRVLELGAGTGLLSAALSLLGAPLVVATERSQCVLKMQENIGAMMGEDAEKSVFARELDWTDPAALDTLRSEFSQPFDLIVGSDVCIVASAVPALLAVLRTLSDRYPDAAIVVGGAEFREGWRALRQAAPEHWVLEQVEASRFHPEFTSEKFEVVTMTRRRS
eukprot:TRINITY_DN33764_c0_g1_i1.p1 TRINITY_DN33764_c0_g1~~TRINITY_DN33764_c0_g1_i1.p1  ORF type:complete len:278 (+),score=81.48 TRINITY_DN33764_c0_g1_i1:67-834(+)